LIQAVKANRYGHRDVNFLCKERRFKRRFKDTFSRSMYTHQIDGGSPIFFRLLWLDAPAKIIISDPLLLIALCSQQ
jgi:hypothetical protein